MRIPFASKRRSKRNIACTHNVLACNNRAKVRVISINCGNMMSNAYFQIRQIPYASFITNDLLEILTKSHRYSMPENEKTRLSDNFTKLPIIFKVSSKQYRHWSDYLRLPSCMDTVVFKHFRSCKDGMTCF